MHDLIIKDGRVIDPVQDIDSLLDIVINGAKIAFVSKDVPSKNAKIPSGSSAIKILVRL